MDPSLIMQTSLPLTQTSSTIPKPPLPSYSKADSKSYACGDLEIWCEAQGWQWVIGVDEAGRGPLAGPVATSAVLLNLSDRHIPELQGINDSKKLSSVQREKFMTQIQKHVQDYEITLVHAEEIDTINILQATLKGMQQCVQKILHRHTHLNPTQGCVLIDGHQSVTLPLLSYCAVKGDELSLAIASASILAKVTRDQWMIQAAKQWPQYHFEKHKGYGTRLHRQMIAQHGPCPLHRRSFKVNLDNL